MVPLRWTRLLSFKYYLIYHSVEGHGDESSSSCSQSGLDGGGTINNNTVSRSDGLDKGICCIPPIGTNGHREDLLVGVLGVVGEWKHLDDHESILVAHVGGIVHVRFGTLSFKAIWLEPFGGQIVKTGRRGTITTIRNGVLIRVCIELSKRCIINWLRKRLYLLYRWFRLSAQKSIEEIWLWKFIPFLLELSTRRCVCIEICFFTCFGLQDCFNWHRNNHSCFCSVSCGQYIIKPSSWQISLSALNWWGWCEVFSALSNVFNCFSIKREGISWESSSTGGGSSLPGFNFFRIILHPSDLSMVFSHSSGSSNFEVWSPLGSLDHVIAHTAGSKFSEGDGTSCSDGVVSEFSGSSTNGFLEWAGSNLKCFGSECVLITGGDGGCIICIVEARPVSAVQDVNSSCVWTSGWYPRAAHGGVIVSGVGCCQLRVVWHGSLGSTKGIHTLYAWSACKSRSEGGRNGIILVVLFVQSVDGSHGVSFLDSTGGTTD